MIREPNDTTNFVYQKIFSATNRFLAFFVTNIGASVNVDIFSSVCYLPSSQGEV